MRHTGPSRHGDRASSLAPAHLSVQEMRTPAEAEVGAGTMAGLAVTARLAPPGEQSGPPGAARRRASAHLRSPDRSCAQPRDRAYAARAEWVSRTERSPRGRKRNPWAVPAGAWLFRRRSCTGHRSRCPGIAEVGSSQKQRHAPTRSATRSSRDRGGDAERRSNPRTGWVCWESARSSGRSGTCSGGMLDTHSPARLRPTAACSEPRRTSESRRASES